MKLKTLLENSNWKTKGRIFLIDAIKQRKDHKTKQNKAKRNTRRKK